MGSISNKSNCVSCQCQIDGVSFAERLQHSLFLLSGCAVLLVTQAGGSDTILVLPYRSRQRGGIGHPLHLRDGGCLQYGQGGCPARARGSGAGPGRPPAGCAWTAQAPAEAVWSLWLPGPLRTMSAGTWAPAQLVTDGRCHRPCPSAAQKELL